jgi:hypothetical protein
MAQIINDPGRSAGLGTALGTGIGQGLSSGLQQLAQNKLNQILQQRQRSNLIGALTGAGYSPQEANLLSFYPPETQFKMMQMLQQPEEPSEQIPSSALMPQAPMVEKKPLEQLNANKPQKLEDYLKNYSLMDQFVKQQLTSRQPQQISQPMVENIPTKKTTIRQKPIIQEAVPKDQLEEVEKPQKAKKIAPEKLRGLTPAQRLQEKKIFLQEQRAQEKAEAEKEKQERLEQHKINKEVFPAYKNILSDARSAREDTKRLNRMEELVKKGNLTRPRWHSLLNAIEHGVFGYGINLHSLETADSQEFDKLSKEFLKNAKNIFGPRITDADLKTFLKMVPDLSQSREGKLAIIHNMKLSNEAANIKKRAADQVISNNNGKLPRDFDFQVEKLAEPELDALASQFATSPRNIKEEKPEESFLSSLLGPSITNPLDLIFGRG